MDSREFLTLGATGVLNLPVICQALKDISFLGPIHCQPEWPELGGPGSGLDRISIPREDG